MLELLYEARLERDYRTAAPHGVDRPVLVEPRLARQTMEVYLAADMSVERNQVVELPLDRELVGAGAPAVVTD